MLVIRERQLEAFRASGMRAFETDMVAHLAAFSPPLFCTLGEERMRDAVRFGIAQARGHALTFRGPVRLYLETMLLLGSRFDTDPQVPWAARILADRDPDRQMERAAALFRAVVAYRETVSGPDDAHARRALRRIAARAAERDADPSVGTAASLMAEMHRLYPEKAAHAGDAACKALIDRGIMVAGAHRLPHGRPVALIVVLMVAFGHGCDDDPLYPWISATLRDPEITDAAARARRLERKAVTWLEHVLAQEPAAEGAAP